MAIMIDNATIERRSSDRHGSAGRAQFRDVEPQKRPYPEAA